MSKITELTWRDIGSWIYYKDSLSWERIRGKLKQFAPKEKVAWVVFKCNDDRDHWQNYTAERCDYSDLSF
jgi:hypothetical protein